MLLSETEIKMLTIQCEIAVLDLNIPIAHITLSKLFVIIIISYLDEINIPELEILL